MRFTINKEAFLKALTTVGHAIPAKPVIALLTNFRLELNEKGLEILGSDNEITIRSTVPYKIGQIEVIRGAGLGGALVNAHMLTEIVRRMEGDEISMEIIDDSVAKIDDGTGSSFRLISAKAEEYPDIDLEEDGQVFEAKCDALTLLVDQSAFAASTKDQRPILTALNLEATGDGQLIATATDSARLARKSIHIDSDVRFRCNVKARIFSDIVRLFEGSEYVKVAISASKALFSFDNTVVATRLVAGDYPVTKAIIPTSFNYFLEVNAQELVNAMGRVSILSEKDSAVKLSMREDECEIYAKNERSGSANERIQTFSFNGERLEVSFNPQFVIDAIKALRADDVTLCFQAEMKPFVVKNPRDDSIVELITPMRTY